MTNPVALLLIAALMVLAYYYLSMRFSNFFQPMRMELIDRAERLLSYNDLLPVDRTGILGALDMVYSKRAAWMMALRVLPISIAAAYKKTKGTLPDTGSSHPHRREIVEFVRVAIPSILSNSPMATFLFILLIIVGYAVMLPVRPAIFIAVFLSGDGVNKATGRVHRNGHAA